MPTHRPMRSRRTSGAPVVVAEALESRLLLSTVPPGYIESAVASGLASPISMEFAPDGRLLVTEQAGSIRVIKNGSLLATPALTLTNVNGQYERGMLSIAFDPSFATNGFVYVYYTANNGGIFNRISRFKMTGDTIDPATETVLLDLNQLNSGSHMGGDLHFGSDGKLYATTGDNFTPANAQDLTNLKGKVLRINSDGSIPTDNPFYNTLTGKNRAIWAYGLRNPFTSDVQPGTGKFFIDDVGQNDWEEINVGAAGANYGWPDSEGLTNIAGHTNPIFTYPHGSGATSGFAITGGAFYNPTQTAEFPPAMIGKYFFADYVNGWIRVLDPATNTATAFASDLPAVVDLEVSPDGSLYYLARDVGQVFRIRYINAPTIVTPPQSQTVPPGSPVTFSVSATGLAPLSYQWQRDGVNISGATGSSYTIASTSGSDNGAKFRVLVTDSAGNAILTSGATWTPGQSGSAVAFDGVDDYAATGIDLSKWLGGTSTLTTWVKTTAIGNATYYSAPGITGVEQSGGTNDIFWGWIDDTGHIGVQAGNSTGARSANAINDGQWHFIALTRDATSGTVQVYVDGALSGTAASAKGLKTTPFSNLGRIGNTVGKPKYFNGALDDVRIYNRVLTAGEVTSAAALPTSGLQSQFKFDENAGTTVFNTIPLGNTTPSSEATLTVAAGSLPVPTIITPVVDSLYTAGQVISFSGSGSDSEDGNLPASAFTWRIDFQHDTHTHPAMADLTDVTSGSWTIPTIGETASNVWYRVYLTVKDSSGQSVTTYRDVLPRKAAITVNSNIAGAALTLDSQPITSPTTFTGVAGIQRSLGAPATQTIGGVNYTFTGWSDGGAASHTISTPLVATTYTANYTQVAPPSGSPVYLSDLTPLGTPISGYGPYEKDMSNGNTPAGDGHSIQLQKVKYTKGLGVHANSDISYDLAGKYGTFVSDFGVDDEVGSSGSVTFLIYIDGVQVYSSGSMTGSSATKSIALNLSGKNTLRLVVDGGTSRSADHADWAGARLLPATAALPAGWSSSNVGSVGQTGSAGNAGGSSVISGSGTDIGGTADSFRYVYQQVSGNVQITARITSLGATNAGAKAGVMLRSDLTAGSINAGVYLTSAGGFSYTRRTATGATATVTTTGTSAFDYWLRIQRVGNTITSFRSADGVTWTQVGTGTVTLGTTIYVGLAVTSKDSAAVTTAVIENVLVTPL